MHNEIFNLRDKKEFVIYLKENGMNLSEDEIDQIKESYTNPDFKSNFLNKEQLDKVAGGGKGFWERFRSRNSSTAKQPKTLEIPANVLNGRLCIVIDSPFSLSLGAERKSKRVDNFPAVLNNFGEPLSPIAGNVTDMGTTTGKTVTLRYNLEGVGDGTRVELYDNSDGNPMATCERLSPVELLTSEEYAPLVQSLQKHYSKGNFDSLSPDQMTEIIGSVPPEILPNIVSNVEYTAQVLGTDAGADGKEKDPQLSSIPKPLLDAIPEAVRTTCSFETLRDIERATCSAILLSSIIPTIVASRG